MKQHAGRDSGTTAGWALSACLALFALSGCGQIEISNIFTPTLTASLTLTVSPGPSPTSTETPSPVPPSPSPSSSATSTNTATATLTPSSTATITPGPSPTSSLSPTITLTPSLTRTPSRTPPPSKTATVTLTPTPPPPEVSISSPGLLSRVISPIKAEIHAVPGDDGLVRLELIGEDGRLISRQSLDYSEYKHRSIAFYPTVPFEINSAAETARLQVLTSDRFGRAIAIESVDLVLLKVGRNEIFDPLITQEPFIIRYPEEGQTIQGGKLVIEGLIRPLNETPVILEVIGEDNSMIFTKLFTIAQPAGELSHTPFQLEIPYKINAATPVRLVFRQEGSRIPGSLALSSLTVILEP